MLSSFPVALLTGAVLGFLAGLGVGGGSLLMLWLTVVLGTSHPEARAINLMFFLPTALISSLFHKRSGSLNLPPLLPAMAAGCICAAVFSLISRQMDSEPLRKIFGGLLIFTGLRELFYRRRKAR